MERSGDEFHERIGAAFRKFAVPSWQHSHPECGPIKLIDGTGAENTVLDRVINALISAFAQSFGVIAN
jgi:hypothetical protein